MKKYLESKGWKCLPCSCPGKKGFDCMHSKFRGVVINSKTDNNFRIVKNSLVIESGFGYQLEQKLKLHGLVE